MIDILMPRLSDTMTEGAVAAWHKHPGDAVTPGDLLLEVETDKALMEQEAYDAGVLREILVPEGESVAVGTPIARLDDGVTHDAPPARATPIMDAVAVAMPPHASADAGAPPAAPAGQRVPATPLVRRIAKERGIALTGISGTGPGGRIVRADLEDITAAAEEFPAPVVPSDATVARDSAEGERIRFDATRRTIAARMTEAAAIPTFTATSSAVVDELLTLRARINDSTEPSTPRVSVNDLVVKAAALALRAHPELNASYSPDEGGAVVIHPAVNIGIAVAAAAGLVVPVVRAPDTMTITGIAAGTRVLAERAAERRLGVADMADGTFTVSNLGMHGVDSFTAIINPPQGAILAVGRTREELTLVDGAVVAHRRMSYTLTADHRIIDGALGARFLGTLTQLLEEPLRLLT
ncbi:MULTISPECIES: dihydrolipoamide acetyltransferase family protein [unclassified Microbacterium]|uniref:dihydrolipoamide acetyltransferase family protein n=1 Tax=unclassified Microbacterium TaxID=2609290 RepID=UPI00301620E3